MCSLDDIAPGKVWVLEVFLTKEESNVAKDQRKDLTAFQASYASLDVNSQLSTILHWRFQSSIHSSKSSTESIKSRKTWRRRRVDSHRGRRKADNPEPVASSTPQQKGSSSSLKSEDAIIVSPGMSKVSFHHGHTSTKRAPVQSTHVTHLKPSSAATSPNTGNETDELYLDAVDDVDPMAAIGPEMLRLFSRTTSQPSGENVEGGDTFSSDVLTITGNRAESASAQVPVGIEAHAHGTGSTSSEGFATPSPTSVTGGSQLLQLEDSNAITSSFQTAYDLSLQAGSEDGGEGKEGSPRHLAAGHDTANPAGKHGRTVNSAPSPLHKATSHQTSSHNGLLRSDLNSESDDDFVDSEDIDEILKKVAKEKVVARSKMFSSSSPPPLVPKRGVSILTPTTSETPPTPPARGNSIAKQFIPEEEDQDGGELGEKPPPPNSTTIETPPTPPAHGNSQSKEEELEEQESDELPPPVPPRLHAPENSMVTGILDTPSGYPFLPMKEGARQPVPSKEVAKIVITPTTSRKTWIYDTLQRYDTQKVSGSGGAGRREVGGEGEKRGVVLSPVSDSHEATPMPTGDEGVATDKRTDITKARRTDDDYEEIDDDVEKIKAEMGLGVSSHSAAARPKRYYEEIDDSASKRSPGALPKVTANPGPVKDVGNAALYLEHDEALHDMDDESKNSSMTVTLDLSHIAKDDIMYSSREKKVGSSVDLEHITIGINGESSAEEAGGDGTVTPVEMTYNESMFGFLQAKFGQQGARGDTGEREGVGGTGGASSRLNDSGEYSSLPDEDVNVFNSGDETEESIPDQPALDKAREKAKNWLSRTMDRRKIVSPLSHASSNNSLVYESCRKVLSIFKASQNVLNAAYICLFD